MNRTDAVAILQTLQCMGCSRKPDAGEVDEMYANFGHKLKPGDGSNLRWRCLACKEDAPHA